VFNKLVNGAPSTLLLHVDDILCMSSDEAREDVLRILTESFNEVQHEQGVNLSFLGMTIDTSIESEVRITMNGFTDDLVREYDRPGSAPTPAKNNLFDIDATSLLLGEARRKKFHSFVAKVLYLSKRIRPEISVPVSFLCTRVTKATHEDEEKLDRVIKYVSGTKSQPLILSANEPLTVEAYVDASYGVHEDGKSHTGAVITLGGGAIFAKSTKQHIVTKSSTEAELVAITDSLGEIVWIRRFLIEQGYVVPAVILYQDNMSTIALCNRGGAGHRTKHIKIRNFFVKERIDDGEVILEHKPTEEMLADVLTKPLQGAHWRYLKQRMVNEAAPKEIVVT
jgi:hypothetical protein